MQAKVNPDDPLATKGEAVEEWTDLHFFRPLGARIATALAPTRVSPDQVTLWSLIVGLVAGHLFVYADPWLNALGFVLFIVSDIGDSADGQLARMRGTSTRVGRILDGVSDSARFVNLYAHLAVRLALGGWHWQAAVALAVAALISHSFQSAAVDFIRHAFLAIGVGRGSELELTGDAPAGTSLVSHLYDAYVRRQELMFPRTVQVVRRLRDGTLPAEARAAYRVRVGPLLGHCAWLGQNIRWALVGVCATAGRPAIMLWIELIPLNLVLLWLVQAADGAAARVLVMPDRRPERVGAR
ncbi:MAG TPA: CDP-alcohol phosphatidyltransferase family protein [Gemmatimonadaceae bacterium]|nr:CDP-alcohol phosphatidyltransferase family protein [Gemmatimonadaceae bacterium]